MHHVFQKFVDQLSGSHDPKAIRMVMADAAAAFDLQCFAYLSMPPDGKAPAALISTYPVGWTDHYLKKHYEQFDPVIVLAREKTEPFEWGRSGDTVGVAGVVNALSDSARAYFAAGGLGILIGDGQLPHYGTEDVVETYYNAQVTNWLTASADYQFIANPAYNRDRGPVSIFGVRLHAQF